MPSFLSLCLTLLRIAIRTTNVVQGLLQNLHNAVEWMIEAQNEQETTTTEEQSGDLTLVEPPTNSETAVPSDCEDLSRPLTESETFQFLRYSSTFPELSSAREVFVKPNQQSTICEPVSNTEPNIPGSNEILDGHQESLDCETQPVIHSTTYTVITDDEDSSGSKEYEMTIKWFRDEATGSVTVVKMNDPVPNEPGENEPLNLSLNSENAGDKSDFEDSSENPSAISSRKEVENLQSERLETSLIPQDIGGSRVCTSSTVSRTNASAALPEGRFGEPRLMFKKSAFDIDLKMEQNLHLRDYDMSTLREKILKQKKTPIDCTFRDLEDRQDMEIKETKLPVKPSTTKRQYGTAIETVEDIARTHLDTALRSSNAPNEQSLSLPRFQVDRSTGNVQWKTDVPRDANTESKISYPMKTDKPFIGEDNRKYIPCEPLSATALDHLRESNVHFPETIRGAGCGEIQSENFTSEETYYKSIRDRVPTPPPKFPIAESSTDSDKPEDARKILYSEYAGTDSAQNEFSFNRERRPSPPPLYSNTPSTDTDEGNGARDDPLRISPNIEDSKFKSTRERRPTPAAVFVRHEQTSSSGTESGIFSEPSNITIVVPLDEERLPSLRSESKNQENNPNTNVRFIDQPLLTRNDRIDSMEKIEFVIQPTCEFIPPGAIEFPPTVSQTPTPATTDSETPENKKYLEKSIQLLKTFSEKGKEPDFCDPNSSATEFPTSVSPTNTTDSEDHIKNKAPQITIMSPTSSDHKSNLEDCNSSPTVRFQLPEWHVERESKGLRRESKLRKPANETSTSEDENDPKLSRKRRASPGKFHKSPKKFAEATAIKIKGYKFSPHKTSSEEKREENLSSENTKSATRCLDFEFEIQKKLENAANLQTEDDKNDPELGSKEEISCSISEEADTDDGYLQQAPPNSDNVVETSSTKESTETTSSSARLSDYLFEDSAPEGTEDLFPELRLNGSLDNPSGMVDSDEQGNDSAPESTRGIVPRVANETLNIEENSLYRDSESDSASEDDADNSYVKNSTDLDKTQHKTSNKKPIEVSDLNKALHQLEYLEHLTACVKNNECATDENNAIATIESASNIDCSEYEATGSPNEDTSKSSTSSESSSDDSINEKSGSDSSNEGTANFPSQTDNKQDQEKYKSSDEKEDKRTEEDKIGSKDLSTNDNTTNQEFVRGVSNEYGEDNFSSAEVILNPSNTENANLESEIDILHNRQRKTPEIYENLQSVEGSSNSARPTTSDYDTENEIPVHEPEHPLAEELSNYIEATTMNRIGGLSPLYEVTANGTASNCSYSESETTYPTSVPSISSPSEEEGEFILEQESPLSEFLPTSSPNNGNSSSESETKEFAICHQEQCSKDKERELPTSSEPDAKSSPVEEKSGEFNLDYETTSSLSSPSKSSNSEVEENIDNVKDSTSQIEFSSNSNTNVIKDNNCTSYFAPVLEELIKRMKSTTGTSSSRNPEESKMVECSTAAEATSSLKKCSTLNTNVKKAYSLKSYFNPVLKELVQRMRSSASIDSLSSIHGVPNTELQCADLINFHLTSANLEEGTTSCIEDISNDSKVSDAPKPSEFVSIQIGSSEKEIETLSDTKNDKNDNLEFELHIVPQPVPCDIAIESKIEVLTYNKTSADQNEIKIVDTNISVNGLDISATIDSSIYDTVANTNLIDSATSSTIVEFASESTNEVSKPNVNNLNSVPLCATSTFVEVEMEESTESTLDAVKANDSIENILDETTSEKSTNILFGTLDVEAAVVNVDETVNVESTMANVDDGTAKVVLDIANLQDKAAKVESDEANLDDEIAKVESAIANLDEKLIVKSTAKNTIGETAKVESTASTIGEAAKVETTQTTKDETANVEDAENALIQTTMDDSKENESTEAMHNQSSESNAVDTSTNLDSSSMAEERTEDGKEGSQENKPWRKKPRKAKKKRRH